MESSESAVNQLVAKILLRIAYLRSILCLYYLGDTFHDHFTVWLVLIFEPEVDLANNFDYSYLGSYFDSSFD